MFFVDDYDPKIGLGGKKGTARADNDIEGPFPYLLPHIESLPQRQLAVKDGYLSGEA